MPSRKILACGKAVETARGDWERNDAKAITGEVLDRQGFPDSRDRWQRWRSAW